MNCLLKRIGLLICITGLLTGILKAQETAQEKTEATVGLSFYKKADMRKTAVALIKIKNKEGKFVPAKSTRVNFYTVVNKEQQLLQHANTNSKGEAVILLHDLPLDNEKYFTIIAKIENNDLYEDAEEKLHLKEANLTIRLNPIDTGRLATVQVTEKNKEGKEIPVSGADVKFYVQRLFGIMPAMENNTVNTDENGEATLIFPKNIPGDTAGAYAIVVRVEDNEKFGNVDNSIVTRWGTVLAIESNPFPRALWTPRAPIPLILTFCILFGGVWTTYFFIFYQMRKISQEEEFNI